ncbi:DnaD domain protein [Ligilactobacillus salivarius]|uniref:DnaD domain protein n=1 Tax=Ligilactobacillus salivarius TaxID=1624 RepID=UPI001F41A0B2|nr:DnaD domain protein [Ligilactobacillus salivarius]
MEENPMNEKPGYYSILTADVRYDERLKKYADCKVLFSEITALSNKYGYCTASNGYFARLYDRPKPTISRWINLLIKLGYLKSEMIYKENSKEIKERRLYPITTPINANNNRGINASVKGGINTNNNRGINASVKDNITSINTININSSSNKESSSDEQINAFTAYQMTGASLTGRQQPILVDYVERLGHELVIHAIEYMEDHTKRPNFSYLRTILNDYEDNHITTVEDAIKNEERFKEHRQKQKNKQNKKKSMFIDARTQDHSKSDEEAWEAFWNG